MLKELRKEKGFTQKEISDIIGMKQQEYSRYERGQTKLNIDLVKKLSLIYNISADYILELTEVKRPLN